MSNEKQLAFAVLMYAQDYDERWIDKFPNYNEADYKKPYYNSDVLWIVPRNHPLTKDYLLKPYLKNDAIQGCPTLRLQTVRYLKGFSPSTGLFPNYAINELDSMGQGSPYNSGSSMGNPAYLPPDHNPSTGQWWATGPFGRKNAQISQPAGLIILWEHNTTAVQCNVWSTKHDQTPDHWDASHHSGFNAAFADGHVKRWSLGQMTNQLVCYWDLPK